MKTETQSWDAGFRMGFKMVGFEGKDFAQSHAAESCETDAEYSAGVLAGVECYFGGVDSAERMCRLMTGRTRDEAERFIAEFN